MLRPPLLPSPRPPLRPARCGCRTPSGCCTAPAAPAVPPVTSGDAMPATRADKLPPIDVGAWLRIGARFQGPDPKKLNDQSMESIYGELHAGGKIDKTSASPST